MGRHSKLTPEIQEAIVKSIQNGCTYKEAVEKVGIGISTFFLWMEKGRKGKSGKYVEFMEAIKKAEAKAISFAVSCIFESARKGQWQAAAWWLERRFPEDWGKKEFMQVDGNMNFPLPREVTDEGIEEAKKILKELTGRNGKNGTGLPKTSRFGQSE
ncbi:MAG: hypothetical protein D6785_03015 [Planctomycetota bacterium]|nr:MAG: hypothetical protein D6785_03015 [Planctomycetota bacterium]